MQKKLLIAAFCLLFFSFDPLNQIEGIDGSRPLCARAEEMGNPVAEESVDYVIGQGDVLEIFIWRNEKLSREVVVMPDGKISLPLIQNIQAQGLTILQLRDRITRKLGQYIDHPKVTVIVTQMNSYKVSVLGRVVKPGVYPVTGNTTLIEALSMAGGLTEWANKRKITVITQRNGQENKITVNYNKIVSGEDTAQNIILQRGDTIIVP